MTTPWRDRAGRFSPLKAAALLLVCLPGLWIAGRWASVGLGPRPITEAIHQTGDWAVYLLLVTLAVSPARRLLDWPRLILVRRILGVAALAYALAHLTLYVADLQFDLLRVASEIVLRVYLAIGFVALVGLIVLGATSTDAAVKRLGRRWTSLHRLAYPITALALLHYFMQSKIDVSQPVLMSGLFLWLMLYRAVRPVQKRPGVLSLGALAILAALGAVAIEAAWYGLMTNVPAGRALAANLSFDLAIRPAWWVLAAGFAAAALWLLRNSINFPSERPGTPRRYRAFTPRT